MKTKLLHYFLILVSPVVFSQSITVSTTSHTVPELVTDVLLNSPCLSVNNINWSTGTNFGSSNGIGYFENTNPNFPLQSGVILSTGNALNAPGPNTSMLNDGSDTWPGDAQLESILANAGINMNSVNATILEFEFLAMSPHFDFDFVFASEEYGNYQCQFSDAFAFLLTNLNTGVTTNLAVVPNTNTPISVVTVRNFLYNSSCSSVNEQYFGSFNGGANAASSPTNFNGNTVVMNASATLSPNTPYKIKLVIADRNDYKSDSAIFISANSFNIGQNVLGNDLTSATGTSVCHGGSYTITSGLNSSEYTFEWKRNGVVLAGETGPNLTVTQSGTYSLTFTNIAFPCQIVTDEVVVEFETELITPDPINIIRCNTGAATYSFNLGINTPIITNGLPSSTTVSYHASLTQAQNNTNSLPTNYTSAGNQTIYVRINNGSNSDCFVIKSFELLIESMPTIPNPEPLYACEDLIVNNRASFNTAGVTAEILSHISNPANYTITYHRMEAQANAGTNALNPWGFNSTAATIYIRVQNTLDSSCYIVLPLQLLILDRPLVDSLEDVNVCEYYILPIIEYGNYFTGENGTGTPLFAGDMIEETQRIYIYNTDGTEFNCPNQSSFMVTIIEPESLDISAGSYCDSYTLPSLPFGNYYSEANGNGLEILPGTSITSSQTVHFYFESTEPPFCALDLGIEINIIESPNVASVSNVFDCTSYTLPELAIGKYYDAAGGLGNEIPAGTSITETQTIYIYTATESCTSQTSFTVFIGLEVPQSTTECVNFTLPALPIGGYYTGPGGTGTQIPAGTVINSTQTIYAYAPSVNQPNCTENLNFTITITLPEIPIPENAVGCEEYILPELALGNYYTQANGNGTQLFPGDTITSSQTIYIYLNDGEGCQNSVAFDITINQKPEIDSRDEIDVCHFYVLTDLEVGNYYTGPNGTGTMLNGGDEITDSQLIYIYAEENGCSNESSFQLNIFTIIAEQPEDIVVCDSYILPALSGNNKYYTLPNGPYGTGTLLAPGTVITESQTIYVFIESGERINCVDEKSFNITIIETPVIGNIPNVNTCNSYILPELTLGNYFTAPNGGGEQIAHGTEITESTMLYIYAETATNPNCFDEKTLNITIFNVDELEDVTTCSGYVLPALSVGRYYNQPNGTGGQIPFGTNITSSQTVYIYAQSGFNPNCSDESSFEVTIVPVPVANAVPSSQLTVCDEDGTNDGVITFDWTNLNSTVLGTQTGAEFVVTYHASLEDAHANTNSFTSSDLTTVYVRVTNTLTESCYAVRALSITVHRLPEPSPEGGVVCLDYETGDLLNPFTIFSGLPAAGHTFEWYFEDELISGANSHSLTVNQPGNYFVIATSNATGCSSEPAHAEVIGSSPAVISFTVSDAFSSSNSITVNANGIANNFEYSLNGGPFQDSNVFYNVSSGIHHVTVRDKYGCGSVTDSVLVINYPKFFTPNGDGYNDTWNITDLKDQDQSVIYIYDRYGKLLKQIFPNKPGWNGTFNGQPMPSTDYWFTVTYEENGTQKEFKAHFSLKR